MDTSKNSCLLHTSWRNIGYVNQNTLPSHLQSLLSSSVNGISFAPGEAQPYVLDGVCTAHCLSFISILLNASSNEKKYYEKYSRCLYDNFRDKVVNSLKNCPTDTEIRTHQAALNTIYNTQQQMLSFDAFLEAKVTAICALKNLRVVSVSENTIDFLNKKEQVNFEHFKQIISELSEGTYLIRAVKPANNHKGEHYGHSMVFIKKPNETYFFDPSSTGGLTAIKEKNTPQLLYDFIRHLCLKFRLNYPIFYEMESYEFKLVPLPQNHS